MARDDGEPEAVQRRRLHLLPALQADELVVGRADERLPEAAHVHGGKARIRNREERRIHADPLQNGFGLDAVAARRLADRTNPAREDAVAQGQVRVVVEYWLAFKRQRKANLIGHIGVYLLRVRSLTVSENDARVGALLSRRKKKAGPRRTVGRLKTRRKKSHARIY